MIQMGYRTNKLDVNSDDYLRILKKLINLNKISEIDKIQRVYLNHSSDKDNNYKIEFMIYKLNKNHNLYAFYIISKPIMHAIKS